MCIAFPGLVLAIDADGSSAVVETEGRRRRASTFLVPDLAVGDWVTVAAGTVVDRLTPEEAAEVQALVVMVKASTDRRRIAVADTASIERRSP